MPLAITLSGVPHTFFRPKKQTSLDEDIKVLTRYEKLDACNISMCFSFRSNHNTLGGFKAAFSLKVEEKKRVLAEKLEK